MRISDWSSDVCSSDLLKVDAINKRRGFSARRSALFAAAMPILSTLFGTVAFLASSTVVSVIFLLLLGFVIAAYNGPANGLVITISDKRVRGLSVASVSKAVSRLEASLGVTLLHRSSRVVTVSNAGEGLLGAARALEM